MGRLAGRLVAKAAPRPRAVPTAYVMQPFEVKLDYAGGSWCTVKFELRHNEISDADGTRAPTRRRPRRTLTAVGLEAPRNPVPVMRSDHQIAQKLHAVSSADEAAHDLIDLQLLDMREDLDLAQVAATCVRLFDYRRQQASPPASSSPPVIRVSLYAEAAEGLDVLPTDEQSVTWANQFVHSIATSMDRDRGIATVGEHPFASRLAAEALRSLSTPGLDPADRTGRRSDAATAGSAATASVSVPAPTLSSVRRPSR